MVPVRSKTAAKSSNIIVSDIRGFTLSKAFVVSNHGFCSFLFAVWLETKKKEGTRGQDLGRVPDPPQGQNLGDDLGHLLHLHLLPLQLQGNSNRDSLRLCRLSKNCLTLDMKE